MAGFSTKESTVFGITRNIEYVGGSLSALTTRDYMIYILENDRSYTDKTIKYLSDTVMAPAFKHWQIKDNIYRQKTDLSILKDTPLLLLSEALHSVAFRGGLKNSIYSPEFMLGKHSSEMLTNFVNNHFVSNRTAIVGLGIETQPSLGKDRQTFFQWPEEIGLKVDSPNSSEVRRVSTLIWTPLMWPSLLKESGIIELGLFENKICLIILTQFKT